MLVAGLNQTTLAERIGTDQPKVSQMLGGKRAIGTYMLGEIAKAVGRPVYDLIGAPAPVELPSGELSTLAAHLKRLKVPRNKALEESGCFRNNADRKAVG